MADKFNTGYCPVCSTDVLVDVCPVVLAGTAPVYNLTECSGCRTRFLNPLPSQEELKRFYAPHYYGSDWFKQKGKGIVFGRFMLPKNRKGRFLDVGCSLGFFLDGIRRSSRWDVYGLEISPEAAAFATEKLKLNVCCGELHKAGYPDEAFDYIHVNNVLEHVLNPVGFLRECRRILRRGGTLYLSVPNGPVDSAGLINFYRSEGRPARSKDGHLFFFSQEALRLLFGAAGFEVVSSHTYGLRRGLRALNLYPCKLSWKRPYEPETTVSTSSPTVQLPPGKRRIPGYYMYRFWQARLKMLPGLWRFGLDFEIILRGN